MIRGAEVATTARTGSTSRGGGAGGHAVAPTTAVRVGRMRGWEVRARESRNGGVVRDARGGTAGRRGAAESLEVAPPTVAPLVEGRLSTRAVGGMSGGGGVAVARRTLVVPSFRLARRPPSLLLLASEVEV